MTKASLPVILLAAGASSRMRGRDKLMEDVDGQPLLRRQTRLAQSVGPVTVALPPAPHPRYTALTGLDIAPLPIPDAAEGMGASLRRAFADLPPGHGGGHGDVGRHARPRARRSGLPCGLG